MDVSRWSSIFSRILDRIGRRLIGRYDAMSSGFFPVFAIIMICPTFHWQGKYSIRSKVLYICYRSGAFLGRSLKDFSGDQVYPGAFWDGFFVTFLTSLIRIFFIGRVVWCGAFSSFLMVSSNADIWDANGRQMRDVLRRPWLFVSGAQVSRLIRIDGIWCWGCFILPVAFHSE